MAGQRVVAEQVAHDRDQTVGTLAAVDRLRRDEHANARRQAQHPRSSPATSRASLAGSLFGYTLTYSHRRYYRVYDRPDFFSLLDGHVEAFDHIEGIAEVTSTTSTTSRRGSRAG